jgi:hypothetical protein
MKRKPFTGIMSKWMEETGATGGKSPVTKRSAGKAFITELLSTPINAEDLLSDDEDAFPIQKKQKTDHKPEEEEVDTTSSLFDVSELEDSIECGICREMLLKPHTTQCAHVFCKACIFEWMKEKKTCPSCRHNLTRDPVYNIPLDGVVQICMKHYPKEDREEYTTRSKRLEEKERMTMSKFKRSIDSAKQKGVTFLDIGNLWNEEERTVFTNGVKKYTGEMRREYIKLIGLTDAFIAMATKKQLENACKNLRFMIPRMVSQPSAIDYVSIQNSIKNYIDDPVIY